MADVLRPAGIDDVGRLAAELVSSGRFADADAVGRAAIATPGRILFSDEGEIAVVERWRDHLPHLLVEGLWCEARRVPVLIESLARAARERGLSRLLTSPVEPIESRPYMRAGMSPLHHIRQMRRRIARPPSEDRPMEVLAADASWVAEIMTIEASSFNDFWRFDDRHAARLLQERRVTIARRKDGPVGYAAVSLVRDVGLVHRLAVLPDVRRQGTGRALLREAVTHLAAGGAREVLVNTQVDNEAANGLYRSEGFRESPERLVVLESDKL